MTCRQFVVVSAVCGSAAIMLCVPGVVAEQRPQPPAQAQAPVFRGDVTLLQVDARVFDRDGRFVATLTKDDFQVFEDGVGQPIESLELIGYRDPGKDAGAPAAFPRGRATDPHTWIFLFDRRHLSPGELVRVRDALARFIEERFQDGDIAGIVDGDTMVFDRISSSRAELLAAVRRLRPQGDDGAGAIRAALDMLKTTSNLFEGLEGIAGAKTVVLVSAGFGVGPGVEGQVRNTVLAAARAGARVYAIDPMGLQRVGGPPDLLSMLSADTGGLLFFYENNFGRALDAIAADAGVYYLLGVRPLNRRFDGRYREIDVRVKVPGVKVRARRGYLAVDPSTLRAPGR